MMLQQLIWFLHMGCALCIIILVLLQHGKGAEMGASFGGSASQTIFGSQGSGSFLTKMTTGFALIFAITSISLSFFVNKTTQSKKMSDIILQEEMQNNQRFNPDHKTVNNKDIPD
jgi:preprotein translocase subunit SecG